MTDAFTGCCQTQNESPDSSVELTSSRSFPDSNNLVSEFANGYLLGELLSKYQLQDDFKHFSQSRWVDLESGVK